MEGLLDSESPKLSKEELQQRAIKYEQVPTDVANGEYMIDFDLTDQQVLVSTHTHTTMKLLYAENEMSVRSAVTRTQWFVAAFEQQRRLHF